MGTIILGYDVESASQDTSGFLEGAQALHQKHDVPWSIYVTGKTVDVCTDDLLRIKDDPLLSIGQHTYNHVLLKSIFMRPRDGKPIHGDGYEFFKQGASLETIREEIGRTQTLMQDKLGVDCRGLTGPWNYYRGLADRPDILQVLRDNGIQYCRCFGRDFRDCQPTPLREQPFFYELQGFPEILELGLQGYQDDFYWDRFDDRHYGDTYEDYLRGALLKVVENDWVWNVCSHDHATPTADVFRETKGAWLEDFIVYAKDHGARFISPETLYNEMWSGDIATG